MGQVQGGDRFPAGISVLLPVYCAGAYLKPCIESILMQDGAEFELIIGDDGSTDDSVRYLSSLNDPRVKILYSAENTGLFANLDRLLSQARYPLIKLFAQDDVMLPDCLRLFIDFYCKHPQVGYFFCNVNRINDSDDVINYGKGGDIVILNEDEHSRMLAEFGSIAGNICNTAFPKSAFDAVGGFDLRYEMSGDLDLWMKLGDKFETGSIGKVLVNQREAPTQYSKQKSKILKHALEDVEIYSDWLRLKNSNTLYRLFCRRKYLHYLKIALKHWPSAGANRLLQQLRYFQALPIGIRRLAVSVAMRKLIRTK